MPGLEGFQFDTADKFTPTYFTPEFYNSNQDLFNKWGYDANGGSSWFGKNGYLPTAFMGLQALGGVLNGITGLQQLGLANKQYNFAKNAFNAQLGNSIENYGNAAANARRVAYALQGGYARNAFGGKSQKEAGDDYRAEVTRNMTRSV